MNNNALNQLVDKAEAPDSPLSPYDVKYENHHQGTSGFYRKGTLCEQTRVILSAPHGGTAYPDDISDYADISLLRSLEDIGTADIAADLAGPGQPALVATYPRSLLDLNRPADALDPLLIEDADAPKLPRWQRYIQAGYGVIPRLGIDQKPLYHRLPDKAALLARLNFVYHPYHAALSDMIAEVRAYGHAPFLLDIHSMPPSRAGQPILPDLLFGDLHQVTTEPVIRQEIEAALRGCGYSWGWNQPYAGGYITQHYGTGPQAAQCLQLEVNRRLFWHPKSGLDRAALTAITSLIQKLVERVNIILS